jgi:single-strand DNA-binding protein
MASYNKVILMGNLTRDPQMSYLPSQTAVVEFGLAVNRRWRGTDGQQREEVCFIDCRAYGKQAETIAQYMTKGKPILLEGQLQFDSWEGKDGVKRSKHRVRVERFQFVGGPAGGAGGGQASPGGQAARPMPARPMQQAPQSQQAPMDGPMESAPPPYDDEPPAGEEIPF